MRWLLSKLIDAYAVTLGPHFGGRCRFEPSCSRYAKEAVSAHGSLKGSWLALKRIVRCGPWSKGGFDPVPNVLPRRVQEFHRHQDNLSGNPPAV